MTATLTRPGSSPETDAADALTDLLTDYIMCRRGVLGHAWEFRSHKDYPDTGGVRWRSAYCPRCKTWRHYQFAGRARVGRPIYDYPENYKLGGHVSSEEMWEELFVREESGEVLVKRRLRGTKVTVPA